MLEGNKIIMGDEASLIPYEVRTSAYVRSATKNPQSPAFVVAVHRCQGNGVAVVL